jgi:hypothetical protein
MECQRAEENFIYFRRSCVDLGFGPLCSGGSPGVRAATFGSTSNEREQLTSLCSFEQYVRGSRSGQENSSIKRKEKRWTDETRGVASLWGWGRRAVG